eukprot:CAMPEP_0185255990 /NCGR_PEP_ID=MMETSP1359-20130426/5051_1 /TAXON_ID=552665 /ORGANISM="Bigelowiella longifila, Strain CCMP242" /LENGTH=169 /DNA_ID=CAMNT_0027840265 /DNA_START=117 /DNA_END=626 /DNA_ORIENTATION=+
MCLLVAVMCIIIPFYIDATAKQQPLRKCEVVVLTAAEEVLVEEEEDEEECGKNNRHKDLLPRAYCSTSLQPRTLAKRNHHHQQQQQESKRNHHQQQESSSFTLLSSPFSPKLSSSSSSTTKTVWGESITTIIFLYLAFVLGLEFVSSKPCNKTVDHDYWYGLQQHYRKQ